MCTHKCLDCFLTWLRRSSNIDSVEYQEIKKILLLWTVGHCSYSKPIQESDYKLSRVGLYIVYLYASGSTNCQDLSL